MTDQPTRKPDPRLCQAAKVPAEYLADRTACPRLSTTLWGFPKVGPLILCQAHTDAVKYGDLS